MSGRKRALLAVVLGVMALVSVEAWSAEAGRVRYLVGTLSVQKPDGAVRILSQQSAVEPGDVLTTEKDSYAQINFADGSQATLRPNSKLKIEEFKFKESEPESDSIVMRLVKGGLRTVTGLIGKRGNQDAYRIGTTTATIGIRGSSGDTLECSGGCPGTTPGSDKLKPGVYHATYIGVYIMTNELGQQTVGVGQFGLAEPGKPPVLLPADPGLNLRDMPFTLGIGVRGQQGGDPPPECVVQ
ncbi:MAG TPA: FecR domain-containing protein [Burkholderiales bacterium]